MKILMYLITIVSCTYIFGSSWSRGQYWISALIGGVMTYYSYKLLLSHRKTDRTSTVEDFTADSSDSRNKLIRELRESCESYRKNREKLIQIVVLILALAFAGCFYEITFGAAVSVFSLPIFYLIHKNAKAIRMIEDGLKKYIE